MEITQKKTGDLNATLMVKVEPEDYRDQVKEVLRDYGRKAKIKGFRPGKVPMSVMRKMFGKGVIYEELNKVISSNLGNYIESEQLPIVGEPLAVKMIDDLDPSGEASYDLEFEVGLAPEFSLDYSLAKQVLYDIEVDDELLEKEIDHMRGRFGPMTNPEVSEEGDILYGKLVELDADGNVVEGGFQKMFAMNTERIPSEDLKKEMGNGKKAEDTFNYVLGDAFETDTELRNFLNTNVSGEQVQAVSDEELERLKGTTFQFEVRKINRIEKIEIGQELFDKAFGEGVITTEEEYRDRVRTDMEGFFGNEAEKFYRTKAIKAMIEGMDLPLPDAFLKRWLIQTREQITEENIEDIYESYARSLRWRLIIEKMQKENEAVKVETEDLQEMARTKVMAQFGSMIPEGDEERMEAFVQYYMQDQKMVEQMFDELLESRVFQHVKSVEAPNNESITATKFMELLKAEN